MKGINNYSKIQEYSENSFKLPVGAYEIEIIRAEEQNGANNSCALCLLFDISDGEYKGFYKKRFDSDRNEHPEKAKYKGVLRLWYPNGGEFDESNEKRLKTTLERIKKSNDRIKNVDFSEDWDGKVLKGCKVGMLFREKEYSINGNSGTYAEPFTVVTLEALKDGNFTMPKPKYLNGNSPRNSEQTDYSSDDEIGTDDDLPF